MKISNLKFIKITLLLVTMIIAIFISSCEYTPVVNHPIVTLPDLTDLSRKEISEVMGEAKIDYIFKFKYTIIHNDSELDKFICYEGTYKSGDSFDTNKQIYVYTTVLPLTFNCLDEVKIDFDYEGKSFINDGIGLVTFVSPTDGDTARFRDVITGETIRVRFLGIDTPESTLENDPWGKAASNYTKARLNNAKKIVLEAEGARTEGYGRYLAFVWVDGVLLNLELIQEAYSNSLLDSKSKYYSYFSKASNESLKTGRRFFGEIDPDYTY